MPTLSRTKECHLDVTPLSLPRPETAEHFGRFLLKYPLSRFPGKWRREREGIQPYANVTAQMIHFWAARSDVATRRRAHILGITRAKRGGAGRATGTPFFPYDAIASHAAPRHAARTGAHAHLRPLLRPASCHFLACACRGVFYACAPRGARQIQTAPPGATLHHRTTALLLDLPFAHALLQDRVSAPHGRGGSETGTRKKVSSCAQSPERKLL